MSIFEFIGIVATLAASMVLLFFIGLLVKDFFGYQRGAQNLVKYVHTGDPVSKWACFKMGVRNWTDSFVELGVWHTVVADPDDDAYDLVIYCNGKIERRLTDY